MDIINLAGTQKYNALGIFQRVTQIVIGLDSSEDWDIREKVGVLSDYYIRVSIKGKIEGEGKGTFAVG